MQMQLLEIMVIVEANKEGTIAQQATAGTETTGHHGRSECAKQHMREL
jgi:hypothetical protein